MKKYTVYRAEGQADRNLNKHVLIAIEYGEDIDAATKAIIRAVETDLSEAPQYAGCEVAAYPPERRDFARTKRYQYYVTGIVAPPNAPENTLVEYGVIEQGISDGVHW
jgi:hypothetical protein